MALNNLAMVIKHSSSEPSFWSWVFRVDFTDEEEKIQQQPKVDAVGHPGNVFPTMER